MGIVRVTTRPQYYYAQEEEQRNQSPPEPEDHSGMLTVSFRVGGMVFDLAYSGFALKEIVDRMNAYEREENTDFIWRIGRTENILSREAYKGDILTDKRVTLDYLTKKR